MCLYKLVSVSALLSTITRLHLDLKLLHLKWQAESVHSVHWCLAQYYKGKNKNIVSRLCNDA